MSVAILRLRMLFDDGVFESMDDLEPTVHLLARGRVAGRTVYCCAGNPGAREADMYACLQRKIAWMEKIRNCPAPIVWLHDAPLRAPAGRTPLPAHADDLLASNTDGVGRAFCLQARLNARLPQISVVFSDCGAAQAFPVRLADFVLLKQGAHLWIGRPDAVRLMLGEQSDPESLGGAEMHCRISGVGDVLFDDDAQAMDWVRRCLACIPSHAGARAPAVDACNPARPSSAIAPMIDPDLNRPFDMRPVIGCLIDAGSWVGIRELYAPEIITGLARVAGMTVGVLANNSIERGGIIHHETCRKMTRMIKFCDTYRIPMLFLADNPGLMVGRASEQAGMLQEASELLRALAVCRAARICLVVRKAYTVGLYAMAGPGFDPLRCWAAPQASISVFGPKALDYFAGDGELPPAAMAAIEDMRRHALDPRDYETKGYISGVLAWPDLRDRLAGLLRKLDESNH